MRKLAENLWLLEYPLSVLGTRHGRNVTVIRLRDGRLILHSMAPFSEADLGEIRGLGEPAWLVMLEELGLFLNWQFRIAMRAR